MSPVYKFYKTRNDRYQMALDKHKDRKGPKERARTSGLEKELENIKDHGYPGPVKPPPTVGDVNIKM